MAKSDGRWAPHDDLGTMRDVIDSIARVVNHITYDSLGKITSETNVVVNVIFAYTGRQRDDEHPPCERLARAYDPHRARMLQRDDGTSGPVVKRIIWASGNAPTYRGFLLADQRA